MDDFDIIGVMRQHLNQIDKALDDAYVNAAAQDLVANSLNVGKAQRTSPLARDLKNARDRLKGYLEEVQDVSET